MATVGFKKLKLMNVSTQMDHASVAYYKERILISDPE